VAVTLPTASTPPGTAAEVPHRRAAAGHVSGPAGRLLRDYIRGPLRSTAYIALGAFIGGHLAIAAVVIAGLLAR
jgi:hypothetical protein